MRLIDADNIPYTMLYKENWMKGTGEEAQGAWKRDIDKMPTIDAVPVVRCKDCKHAIKTKEGYLYGTCNHRLKGGIGHLITPQFFCAYGERQDDE